MKRYIKFYILLLTSIYCASCGQNNTEGKKIIINSKNKGAVASQGPQLITRNIIQDRKGNIWIAAFAGIFRYDGKSFTNITAKITSARFFSVLEDRRGNFWFATIGFGVYYYDGKTFQNFTTNDGLLNNEVTSLCEDTNGRIWFGVSGGTSTYNGKSFQNYIIKGNAMNIDLTGKTFPERQSNDVGPIIQDKTGKLWFTTRGNTFVYDGKIFRVVSNNDKPFRNVRSIIEDKKGNIWLGGADGLWRYDGTVFTNFRYQFVGDIIQDRKGNIWTSSVSASGRGWALSRYDAKTLSDSKPAVIEIKSGEKMIFGILEAKDGSIWFGSMNGVYRYDGKNITDFKNNSMVYST
jgi:ligand-binding sensor domain-containing protein